jgi:hypothetical protein
MNNSLRNLTLSAAALAALTVTAPKASADERGRREPPRQEVREHARREAPRPAYRGDDRHEWREHGYGGYGHGYVAPRPVARYAYAAPFRVFSGFPFYSACPGPNYVYIAGFGWVLPPFFGAVWVPGHYDIGGYWVDGFWQ